MAHHSLDCLAFEKVGVRFEQTNQLFVALDDVQSEIEIRHYVFNAELSSHQVVKLQRRYIFALEHEHHLDQGVMSQGAFRL